MKSSVFEEEMSDQACSIEIFKRHSLMQFLEDAEHLVSLNKVNSLEWVKITFRNWVRVLESQIRKYLKPRSEVRAH